MGTSPLPRQRGPNGGDHIRKEPLHRVQTDANRGDEIAAVPEITLR